MLEKLSEIESRFEEIEARFSMPEIAGNADRFREMMKEHKKLVPIVEKFREYKKAKEMEEEALLLLEDSDSDDPEIRALVKETETVLGENGRILLRASGTESVLRLIIEGDNEALCVDYATRFENLLRSKGYLIKVK